MSRVLLCIDMSYQCYRAAASHPMLTSRRVFTGGLYGFWTTFGKIARETQATDVAFCQDVKPYKRSLAYPQYKQLRKKAADDDLLMMFSQSMKLILESMEESGLRVWGLPGYESDDLIGHCVMKYRHRFDRIYAASNDSDLWQLLWADSFRIYTKDIANIISLKTLDAMGITPEQHKLMVALMGSHNDVEGIAGVGEKRALAAVKDPALLRGYREKHGEMIDRNLELIQLPYDGFPRSASIPHHEGFNKRALYRFLGQYDIEITGSMSSAFDQINEK